MKWFVSLLFQTSTNVTILQKNIPQDDFHIANCRGPLIPCAGLSANFFLIRMEKISLW